MGLITTIRDFKRKKDGGEAETPKGNSKGGLISKIVESRRRKNRSKAPSD